MRCRFRGVTVGILLSALFAAFVPARSEDGALSRLEKAIRSRVQEEQKPEPVPPGPAAPDAGPKADAKAAERGFLGAVTDDRNDRGRGVRVLSVRPQGPAEKAGLQSDDLIVAVAGVRVRQQSDFADILAAFPPGATVPIDVQRGGKAVSLKATLGRRPADSRPAGPAEEVLPKPPALNPAEGDEITALKRRVTELEQRVADLEQAISDLLKK